jgi:endonuclease-3
MRRTERAEQIFARLARANPSPKGELDHVNPYTLLVAVVLSAQATDKGVNRATAGLFRQVTNPQQMLDLGEAGLIEHIKSIGLFRAKAKNIIKLSQDLIDHHGGEVPRTREELEKLPGVGRKTANVVLNMAFGVPTMAVDTHVFRVSQRLGLAKGKTPLAIEEQLLKAVPETFMQHAHHWLILHGRYTCLARGPKCAECTLEDLCTFKGKSKPASPRAGKPAKRELK